MKTIFCKVICSYKYVIQKVAPHSIKLNNAFQDIVELVYKHMVNIQKLFL